MEKMKLVVDGVEREFTQSEVQELIDQNGVLRQTNADLTKSVKCESDKAKTWWDLYQDEKKATARIRKAIEAAKTVLEMC